MRWNVGCKYTNLFNTFDTYVTENNFYTDTDIIIPSIQSKDLGTILSIIEEKNCQLCLIDSNTKNNFINNLLADNREYFIDGIYTLTDNESEQHFLDKNGNVMNYFNWDSGQPILSIMSACIKINQNKKWATADAYDMLYYVMEYNIKRITQYFDNPRIYYQVLNTKEGL